MLCRKLHPVEISAALAALPETKFADTGGTNGHIAKPAWLADFVASLDLPAEPARALVRMLPAGQGIPPHVDAPQFGDAGERRYHVPLVTHPNVVMRWPERGETHHLEAGWLYEVDYRVLHEIVNRAPIPRVHVQINVRGRACQSA